MSYLDVCHLVVVEIAAGGEAFAADTTLMRLLPAVDPPVRVQTRARAEALGANITDMRSLASVDSDVPLEQ